MNLNNITQHQDLHEKALACLILMEGQNDASEQAYFAAKYAEYMKLLCQPGIDYALNNAIPAIGLDEVINRALNESFENNKMRLVNNNWGDSRLDSH